MPCRSAHNFPDQPAGFGAPRAEVARDSPGGAAKTVRSRGGGFRPPAPPPWGAAPTLALQGQGGAKDREAARLLLAQIR